MIQLLLRDAIILHNARYLRAVTVKLNNINLLLDCNMMHYSFEPEAELGIRY